jgi:hypothetical protein
MQKMEDDHLKVIEATPAKRESAVVTSDLKIKANRVNARDSTGPKTHHGGTRSARNAFHGGFEGNNMPNPPPDWANFAEELPL